MSAEMTLEQVAEALRKKANNGDLWSQRYADAIDAHLAKAGEPVGYVDTGELSRVSASEPDIVTHLTIAGSPNQYEDTPIYLAPPSAEPAQPQWPYGVGIYGPANQGWDAEPAQPRPVGVPHIDYSEREIISTIDKLETEGKVFCTFAADMLRQYLAAAPAPGKVGE